MSPFNEADHYRAHALTVALEPDLADQSTVDRLVADFNSALKEHEHQCDKFAGVATSHDLGSSPVTGQAHSAEKRPREAAMDPLTGDDPPRQQSTVVGLSWQQYAETREVDAARYRKYALSIRKALVASVVLNVVLLLAVAAWLVAR